MEKQQRYAALVDKRKQDQFFPEEGLLNPSEIENGRFDCNEIGAWSRWHNDLDAKILLIGQDWGDENYFIKNEGRDSDSNPTCKYLKALFNEIGYDLGTARPDAPFQKGLFFTNAILGIKTAEGGMSGPVFQKWVRHSTVEFTLPLIEIIQPKIIITLGKQAYRALRIGFPEELPDGKMSALVETYFTVGERKMLLFPRYHCGGLGLANRSFDKQKVDWQRIADVFKSLKTK